MKKLLLMSFLFTFMVSGMCQARECTIKTYVWYCDMYAANPCVMPIWVSPVNTQRLIDKSNEDCVEVALQKKDYYRTDAASGRHFRKVVVKYTDKLGDDSIKTIIR